MCIIHTDKDLEFMGKIKYPEININQGEFVFISGESGCGKSSYLKLLNRTAVPSFGNIFYKDENIQDLPVLEYRKNVLLVPQSAFLFDGSIKDNFQKYYEAIEKECISDEEMQNYLNICCVKFSLDNDCKNLSGGEKQRVFLSIFLSCAKDVVLLDEPVSALDEKTAVSLLGNLKEFCKEKNLTTLIICHNDSYTKQFADMHIHFGGSNE